MEANRNTEGDLIIKINEITIVVVKAIRNINDDGVVVLRQDTGGTERVFLTETELREILRLMDEEQ
jgi:hypothetical protein